MALSEARLNRWNEVMRLKIRCKLEGDDLLDERHVRNWPVVVWIARIQPLQPLALEDTVCIMYMHLCFFVYMFVHVCMFVCSFVWMNGWMDGWMDGWMEVCVHAYIFLCLQRIILERRYNLSENFCIKEL